MRLLSSKSLELELFQREPPPYAIVSHRWGSESEEVLFGDIGDPARARSKGKGFDKLKGACKLAAQEGIKYVWLDTCCIDKSNSTELGEAINSMYRWYQKSQVCYVYLHDIKDCSQLTKSDWFTRGWTLQELIAPRQEVKFFNKDWLFIGTRENLIDPISALTGISPDILRSVKKPQEESISQRMFWAAKRQTTMQEDMAYSLLGILNVSTFPIYGIDDAFQKLQRHLVSEHSDNTLFAWYHTVSWDAEMTDPPPTSNLALGPSAESIDGALDSPFRLMNTTGVLAQSPSQYPKSYEISDRDFRKNYMDARRSSDYRSHSYITNNALRIVLLMKQMKGPIWKAVIPCSFDPPCDDRIQRPLVIYLRKLESWKYARVHFIPDDVEEERRKDVVQSFPGSLEPLSDEEMKLEGYELSTIDVVCRYGESSYEDPPKPPPVDPDAPDTTDADRIAQLPRHPPGLKTTNIIVCGEPGVAAGRVVNIIVGGVVIKPLTDYDREAMAATIIDTTLESKHIRIFYIIGPRDPFINIETYHTGVRHMHQLVQKAKESGGIHLMLLCMVGSRVTGSVNSNFRLFHDYICDGQVPMMLIVTGLGKAKRMEDWWDKHKTDPEIQAMPIIQHACITVLRGDDEERERRYEESARMVQQLVVNFVETIPKAYCPQDGNQWFTSMGRRAIDLLLRNQKDNLTREAVTDNLKEGLDLSEAEADSFAGQFLDEHTMEL